MQIDTIGSDQMDVGRASRLEMLRQGRGRRAIEAKARKP